VLWIDSFPFEATCAVAKLNYPAKECVLCDCSVVRAYREGANICIGSVNFY
jgi:hypothetical protein